MVNNVQVFLHITESEDDLLFMLINQYTFLVVPVILFLIAYVASRFNFSER